MPVIGYDAYSFYARLEGGKLRLFSADALLFFPKPSFADLVKADIKTGPTVVQALGEIC